MCATGSCTDTLTGDPYASSFATIVRRANQAPHLQQQDSQGRLEGIPPTTRKAKKPAVFTEEAITKNTTNTTTSGKRKSEVLDVLLHKPTQKLNPYATYECGNSVWKRKVQLDSEDDWWSVGKEKAREEESKCQGRQKRISKGQPDGDLGFDFERGFQGHLKVNFGFLNRNPILLLREWKERFYASNALPYSQLKQDSAMPAALQASEQ
ncbi:hypothetical protein TSAR_009693 [Trichomalopsis sarcophagae]|uniref:Uncharacterized protein n=1 Tax=Trichomalopsis sarcophagae TaxID=543379 RepID=A0A232F087_9HYME|nr:hypothetical protein TSAR_009693 [Trichomalopsis sarcophagae]